MPLKEPLSFSQETAFHPLDSDCADFPKVTDIFDKTITKLYGDQAAALDKINSKNDRYCEGLYIGGVLRGFIVFKKSLDGKKRLELKTLIVRQEDRGKGYGIELLKRVLNVAELRMADGVKLTVSSRVPKVLSFYESMGFSVYRSVPGHYPGTQEHHLSVMLPELRGKLGKKHSKKTVVSVTSASLLASAHIEASNVQSKKSQLPSCQSVQPDRTPGIKSSPNLFSSSNNRKRSAPSGEASSSSHGTRRTCTLMAKYVRQIEEGRKTWEGRCNTNLFNNYKIGDTVKWFAGSVAAVTTEIVGIKKFSSFRDMVKEIGHKALVNETRSDEECIKVYDRIPGYSDKARRYGVVAFQLKVVAPQQSSRNDNDQPVLKRARY